MNADKHTLKGTIHADVRKYLSELGSRGGAATTPAKAKTSRANGQKGGRPRKQVSVLLPNAMMSREGRAAEHHTPKT